MGGVELDGALVSQCGRRANVTVLREMDRQGGLKGLGCGPAEQSVERPVGEVSPGMRFPDRMSDWSEGSVVAKALQ